MPATPGAADVATVVGPAASASSRAVRSQYVRRVVSLTAGCLIMLVSGSVYGFSAITDVIKSHMGFSARDINLIAAAAIFGQTFFCFVGGFLVDTVGPIKTSLYGTSLVLCGYLLVWYQVISKFSRSAVLMAFFYVLVGHGSNSLYMAVLNGNVRNFQERHRPVVTGLLMMCFGLCSAFFTNVYKAWFSHAEGLPSFLMVYWILIPTMGAGAVATQRRVDPATFVGGMTKKVEVVDEYTSLMTRVGGEGEEGEITRTEVMLKGRFHKGRTGKNLLRSVRFMFVYIATAFTSSATLVFMNNTKLIFKANGIPDSTTLIFVTFSSYGNSAGRMIFALISFFAQKASSIKVRAVLCQPFFLVMAAVVALISSVLLLMQGVFLYFVAVILPLAYGALFGILPAYTCMRFGERYFGFNYGVLQTGIAIMNFFLGEIAGTFYDHFSKGSTYCYGLRCYSYTFILCVVATSIASLCMGVVWLREMKRLLTDQKKLEHFRNDMQRNTGVNSEPSSPRGAPSESSQAMGDYGSLTDPEKNIPQEPAEGATQQRP